ncbi:MAG: leucine-rich repeat domain-containing protein [Rhodobacter sp.]|nr:leucine-rich repeat domain-containing protein [Rhodobacter sp.]
MSASADAFRAARAEIAKAKQTGAEELDFSADAFRALDVLPPETGELDRLRTLKLGGTQVSDLAPLRGLTGLQTLSLGYTQVSDLAPLRGLTGLQTLWLHNTQVSDLAPLRELAGLQTLRLSNTPVSDLAPLRGLTGLQFLYLNSTQVSDLASLRGLTRLQSLDLDNTQVSDLTPLQGLTGLQDLWLHNTQVSDLAPLQGLTGLQTLWLGNTQVSDLAPLQGLTGLQTLDLDSTQVSDLAPLQGLTGLQTLWLHNTQVSDLTPLRGLTGLQTLLLNDTQVSDLAPLQGLTGLQVLSLSYTPVSDLAPLQGLTALQTLDLDNTQVRDLAPLQGLTGLRTLSLDSTRVLDLRPLAGLRKLADEPEYGGLMFRDIPATADPKIAEIAEIEDDSERAKALFALLDAGWVPPVPQDMEDSIEIPLRQPAPLEIEVTDTLISVAGKDGLQQRDANARAAMGWEALCEYRKEFAATFSVSNYAPLPAYLSAFDRAMGDAYDPARVVMIGVQAQRFVALSRDASFTTTLPDGAAGDLRTFAAEMLVYLNRFPDWVAYRDDAEVIDPDALREVGDALTEIRDTLNGTEEVTAEVKQEYAAEVAEALSARSTGIEAKAIVSSTRELPRELAEHEARRRRTNRALAKKGGDYIDGMVVAPLGVPYHLALKLEKPLRELARRFPTRFGWLTHWYDATFGLDE